jgi:hypothetical protein
MTKEEMRTCALKEIFYFYSRQHQYMRKELKGTFDSIKDKHEHLDLGEFMKFCVEFKIMLKKEALMEMFKKTAENTRELTYDKFNVILTTIASKVNEDKVKMLLKKLKKSKADLNALYDKNLKKLNDTINESNVLEREDSVEEVKVVPNQLKRRESLGKQPPIQLIKLEKEVEETQTNIKELKAKTLDTLIEELFDYIGLDSNNSYRTKMKGFLLPFSSHNKQYRIPPDLLMKKVKKLDARTADEIKRIITERKIEKIRENEEKEKLQKLMAFEQRKKLNKMNRQIIKHIEEGQQQKNYTDLAHKHENFEKEKESKITWDQLENLKFDHFITNRDDDFHPEDLIDLDYDSDDDEIFRNNNKAGGGNKKPEQNHIFNYNNVNIINEQHTKISSNEKLNQSLDQLNRSRIQHQLITDGGHSKHGSKHEYIEMRRKHTNESVASRSSVDKGNKVEHLNKGNDKNAIHVISSTRIIPDQRKKYAIKRTEAKAKEADQTRLENAIKVNYIIITAFK